MTPRIPQRVWAGMLLAAALSGLTAGPAAGQDEQQPAAQDQQPAAAERPASEPASQPVTQEAQPPASQPVTRPVRRFPASRPSTALTTSPATQDARRAFEEMQQAAKENGVQPGGAEAQAPASQPAGSQPVQDRLAQIRAERERRRKENLARIEEARRKAREATQPAEGEAVQPEGGALAPIEREPRPGVQRLSPEDEGVQPSPTPPLSPRRSRMPSPAGAAERAVPPGAIQPGSQPGAEGDVGQRIVDGETQPVRPAGAPGEAPVSAPTPSPDGRDYFISFKGIKWEDVVRHYAKLVGKPVMGEITIGGELTYESPRRFTKEEMRDELNFLLLEQGHFIAETEDYIYLVPVAELSKFMPMGRFFESYEAFEAAGLRDKEFASAIFRVTDQPAQAVQDMLAPSMPDRALPVVVPGDTNSLRVTGLAMDVRRFKQLADFAKAEKFDPRQIRIFDITTNAAEIERLVRSLLGITPQQRRYDPQTRQWVTVGGEGEIRIIADERTNTLIVKGTPAELKEVETFIKQLDKKPDIGEFKTTVVPVQYGNAAEIADLLTRIFQQEEGSRIRTPTRLPTQPGQPPRPQPQPQPGQPQPQDIIVEDIYERAKKTVRIVADSRSNTLIVYANEEGLKRVKDMLAVIDTQVPSNFRTFRLQHAKAEQIQPTVEQIARGAAAPGRGRGGGPTVVADALLNAVHVIAEREEMERIAEVIQKLDVEGAQESQHVLELRRLTPSRIAPSVSAMLTEGGVGVPRPGRPGRAGPTAQVIPLDEASLLIVICTDEEWAKVESTVKLWDEHALSNQPVTRFYPVKSGSIDAIRDTVEQLYRNYRHPVLGNSPVFVDTVADQIVVLAIEPALEEIGALIAALDQPSTETPVVLIPLEFADAQPVAEVAAQAIAQAAAGGARGQPRRPGGRGPYVQAEPLSNSVIVVADAATVERVKALAKEMDQKAAAVLPERRFYVLKNAAPRDVVSAITQLFGGAAGVGRPRAAGTKVTAVVVGNQVVVDAPAIKQAEIAAFVQQLDAQSDLGISTVLVKLTGADVNAIAQRLSRAFDPKVREQGAVARFEADQTTETILMTVSKEVKEEAERLLAEYQVANAGVEPQVRFFPLKHAAANEIANWLREQLVALMDRKLGRAAAQQVQVTPETRTNRLIVSAPLMAVTMAETLIEQMDVPMTVGEEAPVAALVTEVRKLPGLDVDNIARLLDTQFRAEPPRPDKLRYTFGSDRLTEMVVFTVPKDSVARVDEAIQKFAAELPTVSPEQKIIQLQHADASYVAQQIRENLNVRIAATRGTEVARRVNVVPDTRLNTVIVNGPKFAIEMAEALVAELDQPATTARLHTIPLANADAGAVLGILNTVYGEKVRARTLQLSAEPLTNALIVGGAQADFEEIRDFVTRLDGDTVKAISEPKVFELKNANPWDVHNVLQATYGAQVRGPSGARAVRTQVMGDRSIVVQAPSDKLEDLGKIIAELDRVGSSEAVVRTYRLPGLGPTLTQLARQIQDAANARITGREPRVAVTAVPASDALIVTALEKQLALVEQATEQFKTLYQPAKIETIPLANADANLVLQALQKVLASKVQAGGVQLSADPLSNTIIVSAGDEDLAEIRRWATEFDQAGQLRENVVTIVVKNADPNQLAQTINQMFVQGPLAKAPSQQVSVTVANGTLVVKGPPAKIEAIRGLVAKLDEADGGQQVKLYPLKVLNAQQVAVQVQAFLRGFGGVVKSGQMQPGAFAEPTTNTLVVLAPADKLPFIDGLVQQIESQQLPAGEPRSYALRNVRADQIAANVEQMLKARVLEKEGPARQNIIPLRVLAEPTSNRLFVQAPEEYHKLAAELVRMIDEEVETGEVVHVIRLEQANATDLANTIRQTLQGATGPRGAPPPKVAVSADAGSNTIVLSGLPKDVAEIESLVTELEASSNTVPELQIFKLENTLAADAADALKAVFPAGRSPADAVTVAPDEYYNRLLVTASKRRMRQVEAFVQQLDAAPPESESGLPGDRELHFVELYRADPTDVAFDLEEYFPPDRPGGPRFSPDYFNPILRVVCRANEFPKIEKLIREFDRRAKAEQKYIFIKPRGDIQKILALVRAQYGDVQLEHAEPGGVRRETIVETLWRDDEAPAGAKPRPAIKPASGNTSIQPYLFDMSRLPEYCGQEGGAAAQPPARQTEKASERSAEPELKREPVKITVMPDGRIAISGPSQQVGDIEDAIDLLQEDLGIGEVIRIFQFKYGDVNAAARILDLMFNEPQAVRIQGMGQLQQLQQQLQQRRQQEGRGEGREGAEAGGLMQQLQNIIGGGRPPGAPGAGAEGGGRAAGGQRIRIATDASHNYLIVKCDESLLPDVRQLLREMDIPPSEVDIQVFQLRNLDARETAENIKEVLGISRARQPRQPQLQPGRNPQQQLMELLTQQMVTLSAPGPGGEVGPSAKIENVEVVPNAITNSILVSAPREVMEIIRNVIGDLERLEGREITVIEHYPLQKARVDDILPLLQEIFSAAGPGGGAGGRAAGAGTSPAELGAVTISGDPRRNTLIFVAQAKDVPIVVKQIEALDIEGAIAEADLYICQFGDAVSIAQAVEQLLVQPAAGSGRRGGGPGAGQAAGNELRLTAEPMTNTILVWGSLEQRDLAFEQIERLDALSKRNIRQIDVNHANPETLAERLRSIFGGTGATAVRPRGGRGGAAEAIAQTQGRLVIEGDKNAGKLLVRAPDALFEEIKAVAATLDVASEQLQIRRYALQFANAQVVVDTVKGGLTEYIGLRRMMEGQQAGDLGIDAFTAVADPRSNSIVVVGSPQTFAFVETLLTAIDVDTPEEDQKQLRVFVLREANAQTMADAINSFARGGSAAAVPGARGPRGGLPPRMPGLPGMGSTGGGLAEAPLMDVFAVAEASANAVMVMGRPDDIDTVEARVIKPLEGALVRYFENIPVQHAPPSQIASLIAPVIESRTPAEGGRGVVITPNDPGKTVAVWGTREDIAWARDLVTQFDVPGFIQDEIKIIPVPFGQDATALAGVIERVVNEGERIQAEATGRPPRFVTIGASPDQTALFASGNSSKYGQIEALVNNITQGGGQVVTRVIQLQNLSAQDAQSLIDQMQNHRRSRGTGGTLRPTGGMGAQPGAPGTRPPSRTPTRITPSQPQRRPPSGGIRPQGQRPQTPPPQSPGAWRRDVPDRTAPGMGAAGPFLAAAPVRAIVLSGLLMQAAEEQAAGAARPQPEPGRAAQPATQPLQLNALSGTLRGEVLSVPLDSRQLMITGDQRDVDFILQMLEMMEGTTPQPVIQVVPLEYAKAAAIAPIIDNAMQAYLQTAGGEADRINRFTIIAEARSNSLIIAASATNIDLILEMVAALDREDVKGPTQFKAVPLTHIRAAEAVQILQQTIDRLNAIRKVSAEDRASIQSIDRSNSVLIVGTPADIAEIERMVEGIDVELPPEESFTTARVAIVELKNATAADLAETLNAIIEVERAAGGAGAAGAAPAAGRGARTASIVRKLLFTKEGQELPPLDLDKPIKILAEKGTNALLIFSTPKNNEALTAVAGLFDELPTGLEIEVKSFALKHAPAETVAKTLQDMFDNARRNVLVRAAEPPNARPPGVMAPAPPGIAGKGLPYAVQVTHDVRSNSVLVVGHKDAVLLAAGLIAQLDAPGAELNVRPYIIHLRQIQATTLQEKLQKLLDDRLATLGGNANKARDSAIITPDDRSNALIVVATPETYQMVADLAQQLDAAESYRVVDTQYRRMKFADAAKLSGMLQQLFDKKGEANQKTKTQITDVLFVLSDARSNSIMLTGTRDYVDEAQKLIDQLDQQFDPTVVFKVRPLLLGSAANIATLLTDMIEKSRTQPGGQQTQAVGGTPIHVSADAYSNSLLLAASAEDMISLERWIELLDRPPQPGRITRIIPLVRGDAEQVAQQAEELFRTQAQGAAQDVTVAHDATTNSVVVIGPPTVVRDVSDFVAQLNGVTPPGGDLLKIFKLEQADAEVAGELLRSILEGRSGSIGGTGGTRTTGGTSAQQEAAAKIMLVYQQQHPELGAAMLRAMRKDVTVIDDLRTNSLIITAPPESMPLIESLVAAIDVPPDAAKIRIFPLKNSDAAEMVDMLDRLFQAGQAQTRTTTAGAAGEGIEGRQLTLGEGLTEGGRQVLTFTTDARTNSVIAAGTKGYLDLVEELILQLDSRPIEVRKVMVYQPHNNAAPAIQQAIADMNDREKQLLSDVQEELSASQRMSREILAVASEDTNRVLVNYDPRREGDVLELIRELDQPPPQVMIQVLIVEVTMDNALELGVEFAFEDLQFTKAGPNDTTSFDFVGGTDIGAAGTGLGGFSFTVTGKDFNFLFRALQNEGILNVLSHPQIVAMDNQEARIEIVNDVPYVTSIGQGVAGQITTSVAREEIGIRLTVTPQINPDGFVRMQIEQEVSDLTGSTVEVGQGVTAPIFFRRVASTTVTVKDTETVVLGGLITSREEHREQKVPILGDIPVAGTLFRFDTSTKSRTELLVILTPRIIRTVEDYRELSVQVRDRTSVLPPEMLTNPLMDRLRVKPEELGPPADHELLGPFPPEHEQPQPADTDIYGPIRSKPERKPPAENPDSYEVPVTRISRAGGTNP